MVNDKLILEVLSEVWKLLQVGFEIGLSANDGVKNIHLNMHICLFHQNKVYLKSFSSQKFKVWFMNILPKQ